MTENQKAKQYADNQRPTDESSVATRERWPVLHEQPLLRAERRLWRRYRDTARLPLLKPGCVYVFAVRNRYEKCEDGGSLRGDEPMLVDASSVSVVATRSRRIRVWTYLPTTEIATELPVVVTFRCEIVDPGEVARIGLCDLRGELESRVRHERSLTELRHQLAVDDIAAARHVIATALDTTYSGQPLHIPGMNILFEGAQVKPSTELLRHQTQLRNAKWLQREHQLKHAVERQRVTDIERDLLASAERSEATAVTREERTAAQTAARQFQERDTQTERLTAQVKEWLAGDAAKRAPVDRRQLVEALFARLIDTPGRDTSDVSPTGIVDLLHKQNGHVPADIAGHIAPDDLGE